MQENFLQTVTVCLLTALASFAGKININSYKLQVTTKHIVYSLRAAAAHAIRLTKLVIIDSLCESKMSFVHAYTGAIASCEHGFSSFPASIGFQRH